MGRERAAADAMLPLGVDLHYTTTPLDSKTVAAMFNDTKVFRELKALLNVFENYVTAVNSGAVDFHCAYNLRVDRFLRLSRVFAPFVAEVRHKIENEMYLIEMERLAKVWRPRRVQEQREFETAREGQGVGRRY